MACCVRPVPVLGYGSVFLGTVVIVEEFKSVDKRGGALGRLGLGCGQGCGGVVDGRMDVHRSAGGREECTGDTQRVHRLVHSTHCEMRARSAAMVVRSSTSVVSAVEILSQACMTVV